jgi:hypothetical protein
MWLHQVLALQERLDTVEFVGLCLRGNEFKTLQRLPRVILPSSSFPLRSEVGVTQGYTTIWKPGANDGLV